MELASTINGLDLLLLLWALFATGAALSLAGRDRSPHDGITVVRLPARDEVYDWQKDGL